MTRIRTRSQFQFDSASRQLDTRDLDSITDPTTDLGAAVADAVAEYQTADGLLAPYPGLDIMEGSISGPLSQLGTDFGDLAAVMDRASGYEDYPAELPSLGAWTAPGESSVKWTPTEPGIYQWYAMTRVDFDVTVDADTIVSFKQPLPDIIGSTWGADNAPAVPLDLSATTYQATAQGLLMVSENMLDAGYGGLAISSPHYQVQGSEIVDANYLLLAVSSWSPAGTVPYLGGI